MNKVARFQYQKQTNKKEEEQKKKKNTRKKMVQISELETLCTAYREKESGGWDETDQ